ncbi:MAG: glucose-6-phosphate isomerase, partial [Spirochaetaceae bacterium]|nr:glucose-6-phosphate isomerase [Spirochaetaceae bacterium]
VQTRNNIVITNTLSTIGCCIKTFYVTIFIEDKFFRKTSRFVGMLSLAFGGDVFREFLEGAHEADKVATKTKVTENASLLDALIGVFERNVLEYGTTAVLPYSQALSRFPAHLQQADMESNGKSVNRFGKAVTYETGPAIFGEPGTNGQHSFYQLLHQGTSKIPLQFVGFQENQTGEDVEVDGSTGQTKLCANLVAQIVAFALGKSDENPNKNFQGGRPSSLLVAKKLTPKTLGALLAHFENKIMFQGFVWNLNSFDQEGVQLGKILTKKVLSGERSPELAEFAKLLNI